MTEGIAPLGSLLEESITTIAPSEESEFIPTLSSLLLSTAESLQARSRPNGIKAPTLKLTTTPKQLIAEPQSIHYLSSLLELPLSSIKALPSSLATLSTSLDSDLSSLAFTKYQSFLLSHSATSSIATSFSSITTSLGSLLSSTDELETTCLEFQDHITDIKEQREKMNKVRERMLEVEELLEIPSVVDTCVRVGYWLEALSIAAMLQHLYFRMSPNLSNGSRNESGATELLGKVSGEVSSALISLRARVLESFLQRGLKLPGLVRGVGILRRMNAGGLGMEDGEDNTMSVEVLRVIFLNARWRCLRAELEVVEGQMVGSGINLGTLKREGLVAADESETSTRWVKRWIEVWREVVGETVGMYSEVFLATPTADQNDQVESSMPALSPLTLFLSVSLNSLSATLLSSLPSITSPSSLNSLLTQLAYCSHSFARYGLEFREIETIREKMEERVVTIIQTELELAGKKWEKELREGYESTGMNQKSRNRKNRKISDWLVVPEGIATVLSTALPTTESSSWHHQPPSALALLPPLARLLNSHASAFNSLRLFPAKAIFERVRLGQAEELDRSGRVLEAFIEGWRSESQSNPKLSLENGDSTKEELLKYKEQEVEKSLMIFTVAAFGRWFLFWCGNLSQSVFEEIAGDKSMEPIVEFSIKRAELLLRKIEGKEEIVVESIKELELEAPVAALGGALKIVAEVDEELDLQAESVEVSKLNGLGATIELNEEELEELDAPSEGVVHSKVDELAEVTVEEQNKVNEELVTD